MKMRIRLVLLVVISGILITFQACKERVKLASNAHEIEVEEVIQTSAYTYIRATEDGNEYWMAINQADVKEGGTYYWSGSMEMKNFTSRELKRTFPSILFVENFTDQPITAEPQKMVQRPSGRQPIPEKTGIMVPKAEGGITIAELFSNFGEYAGKSVRIRGEVVKFSSQIMNRNWVHIQDGTKENDKYDLTVTTTDSTTVGAVVLIEGTVAVNKDFGAGYFYEVIVENAKLK
jgi:hypothetical protein